MAYAALISLANTIDRIHNHNQFSIPLEAKQQIISLSEYVTPFQTFLEKFPDKFNGLEGRMRELVCEAEDVIDYFMLEQVSECHSSGKHELPLEKVIKEIDSMAGEVKKIEDSSKSKGDDQHGADSSALSSSSTAPPIRKDDAIVGFEDHAIDVKDRLCGESSKLEVIPICGMGGIGKTTLAKNVYNDPLIMENFVIRVWVTISQDYSAQRILSSLLESLKGFLEEFKPDELEKLTDKEKLYKILIGRKYLVVMDDMWSSDAWDVVRKVFPDDSNGSRIMLTTRLSDVASYPDSSSKLHEMQLMDADRSWDLLKQKVFEGDEDCPSELQKIGKKIARNCKGLPLAIVVIAGLLSTVSKNRASWQEIAENVKSAATAEKEQIEEILSLSYTHLPQYLRPCFLYMGSFPEDAEISVKKLIKLWIAEGFMKPPMDSESFEKVGEECLEELVKRNLVLVKKRKFDGRRIRSCSLHDLMRDLCIRKAHESKLFLNQMEKNIGKKRFTKSMQNQRRVNVDSSNLNRLSSLNGSTIHSIKCSSRHLVKPHFLESVRLLRVLDAEPARLECSSSTARLYEIFHLRYLDITIRCHRHFSRSSLLKLQNLQTLIIHKEQLRKTNIVAASHLRLHWSMPQLRHVYFYGTICFDDPKETDCSLESLQTLSYVGHKSCNERTLKKIPNLKKLKINCSGGVRCGDAVCLNDLVHLHRLKSLEVYAASLKYEIKFTFPRMLKKLSLRMLGLRWNGLAIVGSLPNLQVLKLKDDGCVGSTWETMEGVFPRLEVLLMEDLGLENWITESSHFPCLKRLLLHYCWKLNGIPNDIGEIPTLEMIEVKGIMKKSLVESAEEIQKEQEELGNNTLQVLCINAMTINVYQAMMMRKAIKLVIMKDDEDDEDECDLDGGDSDEFGEMVERLERRKRLKRATRIFDQGGVKRIFGEPSGPSIFQEKLKVMEIMKDMNDELNDDLQMLGSFPTPQGTKGTHANIDCGSSTFNVSKSKSTRDEVEDVDDRDPKKGRADRSDVWKHFIRVGIVDGVEKCQCKYCDKLYSCKAKSGTTSLKRHLEACIEFPKSEDVKKWKFDTKDYRDALARCIIKHDLPFSYAEYDGVNDLNTILNPEFKPVSRNTAKSDCMNVFLVEKQKLKSLLATIPGRICLTSDCWTALTTQGYMTVTAHYVDENWKLNSKLLSFCELTSPHSGYELSRKLLGVLKDWGIESKIFTLTLDNATSCDNMVRILKDRLNLQNGLLCQGEFFHVRCCAHILNLIVQEGLKVADDALRKIRGSVKYVKASDGRLRQFHKCIEEVGLSDVGGSFLRLDVSTRWNSTYLMLESAIKYRLAFTSLSYYDTNYKHCPTDEEWERADKMHAFLEPFYEITKLLSGSSYPTSNLYFKQIAIIEGQLVELMDSKDDVIKDMASRMKVKFDKYWDEYCGILAFGCILDPRSKLKMMSFCYEVLYPQDYEEKVHKLKKSLYKLFSQYERVEVASISFPSSTLANPPPKRNMFDAFEHKLIEMNSNESELNTYLEEACIVGNTIDILEYWSMNKKRFPRLSKMACDVLSIPVTTVASESTFSIGGRILNKYRNCLLPETVQALICTRNWLHGFKKTEDSDQEVEVEEIELLEKDSNVLEFENDE